MASKAKLGETVPFVAGPWTNTQSTINPIDDSPNQLTDALNGYFPDAVNGGEFAARPGFVTSALSGSPMYGAGAVVQVESGGTLYLFALMDLAGSGAWKLYRGSASVNPTWTDVSPVGITMTSGAAGLSHLLEYNGQLVMTDSVNQPWLGTNLSSTPITGTKIPIDTANDPWVAIGAPTIYVDSLFFICATTVANAVGGISFVWSEPNQPLVGYMQSGFADFWNIFQTGSRPLFCIQGTNAGLYFSRETSWGVAVGTPSVNFSATATNDVVSYNVGCVAAKTVQVFGNYIYFCDAIGRPWRMAIGGIPEPIWLQMRQFVDAAQVTTISGVLAAPSALQSYGFAVIEPNFNKYLCFPWGVGGIGNPWTVYPTTGYSFDAQSGHYESRWQIHTAEYFITAGCQVLSSGTGAPTLTLLVGVPVFMASTFAGSYALLQSPSANVWADAGNALLPVMAQTQRLGYSASVEWDVNTVRAVTNNQTPVALTTVATSGTVNQGNSTPPASSDGTNLAQWAPVGTKGRGIQLQLSPTTTTSQWRLFRAEIDVTGANVQMSDG